MSDDEATFMQVRRRIKEFNKARNWDKYHTPKDLAVSISIEAAELLENFQWEEAKGPKEIKRDRRKMGRIEDEVADLMIYLLVLCDRLDIDASDAIANKIARNEVRFPAGDELSFRK